MCREVVSICVGFPAHTAVMFMNSNKSERNVRRMFQESRRECMGAGITLMHECIVSKGPNRDVDRDAVNRLVSVLISGRYDTVVVERLSDLTADASDLEEFMRDAARSGIGFFELSTMRYHMGDTERKPADRERLAWDGGAGC